MPKHTISADQIQRAVLERITSQQYRAGERLPSVRALAQELGANRNTVNRAYQLLAGMSVIELVEHGRGGFRVKPLTQAGASSPPGLRGYFYQQSLKLIWQGLAAGFSADEVSAQLSRALREVFNQSRIAIAFFECNSRDSQEMGHYLAEALQQDIYCGLLDELTQDAKLIAQNYDVIITTLHHLSAVLSQLEPHQDKVIGIDTRPTPDTLLKIARLPKGHIGVVATLPNTAQMLKHILYSYYPDRLIEVAAIDNIEATQCVCRHCDHLIATHTCAEVVRELSGRTPEVEIHFQVDQASIKALEQRIRDIRAQKMQGEVAINVSYSEYRQAKQEALKRAE
jgi:GntR family transcriptional regulator